MCATVSAAFGRQHQQLLERHVERLLSSVLPDIADALRSTLDLVSRCRGAPPASAPGSSAGFRAPPPVNGPSGPAGSTSGSRTQVAPDSSPSPAVDDLLRALERSGHASRASQLRRALYFTPSELGRLAFAFGYDPESQTALDDLRRILRMFDPTLPNYLSAPETEIDPHPDPAFPHWAEVDPDNPYTHMWIGRRFFNPSPPTDDVQLANMPRGASNRLEVLRDAILVHESVHLHIGGGHCSHDEQLLNPYMYQAYVIMFRCRVGRLERTPQQLEEAIVGRPVCQP